MCAFLSLLYIEAWHYSQDLIETLRDLKSLELGPISDSVMCPLVRVRVYFMSFLVE